MSTSPLLDVYDAQMLDFHDFDVPMNVMASSEFYPEASMDHDEVYREDESVEVDMEEYKVDHSEYEMVDETAGVDAAEPLDVEVFDVSLAHTPLPGPDAPLPHPLADLSIESDHFVSTIPDLPITTSNEHENEVSAAHPEHLVSDAPDSKFLSLQHTLSADTPAQFVELATSSASEEALPSSEGSQHPSHHEDIITVGSGRDAALIEQPLSDVTPQQDLLHGVQKFDVGREELIETALAKSYSTHVDLETSAIEHQDEPSGPDVLHTEAASHVTVNVLEGVDSTSYSAPEDTAQAEGVDTSLGVSISEGVYIDPPPAVLLSVGTSAEVHSCLFNQPFGESSPSPREDGAGAATGYHLLLETRPTLYYEPLSNVFDAVRQDEDLLSQVPHSFEGELVLDAYDLQLAISEDNVHSREISLHDLNILHDGSDLAGPLRLRLIATTPRFIFRYYTLYEQIQKLDLSVAVREGEQYSDHENQNAGDLQQDQGVHDRNEEGAALHPTEHTDESANQPTEGPEQSVNHDGDTRLPSSATAVPVPQLAVHTDYHEAADDKTEAHENGNDDEAANVTDTSAEEVQNAEKIHNLADTDHAAITVVGYGEQTDYQESLLAEEYDEEGEEFRDDAHRDSQIDDATQYETEEVGEGHDESVNESAVLADSGPDTTTPIPHHPSVPLEDSPNQLCDSEVPKNPPTGMCNPSRPISVMNCSPPF
ncbi:hypothetical protein J3A83DRAFT_4266212 [Scleroderma citrinum]